MARDSVGGIVECAVTGLPAGLGGPLFGGVESLFSSILFGIPAVKGVEFGEGFGAASLRGSENNDPYTVAENGEIRTVSNHAGRDPRGHHDRDAARIPHRRQAHRIDLPKAEKRRSANPERNRTGGTRTARPLHCAACRTRRGERRRRGRAGAAALKRCPAPLRTRKGTKPR